MSPVLAWGTGIAIALLGVAILLCALRLIRGPTASDRILALDTLYINGLALLITVGIRQSEPTYFDAALLIALLGFVGTVALAKYRLAGDVIE